MITSESDMQTGGAVDLWTGVRELADGQCLMVVPVDLGAEVLRWARSRGHRDRPVLLMPPQMFGEPSIGCLAFATVHTTARELVGARTTGSFAFPPAPVAVDLADLVGRPVKTASWLVAPTDPVQLWEPNELAGALRTVREREAELHQEGRRHGRAVPPYCAGREWELLQQAMDGARW